MNERRYKISEQLRKAIRRSGLTHYYICKHADLDQGQMSNFMRRRVNLSLNVIDRIGKVLDLQLTLGPKRMKG